MPQRTIRSTIRGHAAAVVAALALVIAACGPMMDTGVVQPAPPGTALTPENVAALLLTANTATIQRAQVARVRASDPNVRAFADRVLQEQQMIGQVLRQGMVDLGIRPVPEATAMQLESSAGQTVAMMQAATGTQVDRIYLESEIANHRWLISTLDTGLIPAAPDAQSRQALSDLRQRLSMRLAQAERLQTMLIHHGQMPQNQRQMHRNR